MKTRDVLVSLRLKRKELAAILSLSPAAISMWGERVPEKHAMRLKAMYPRLPLGASDYLQETAE